MKYLIYTLVLLVLTKEPYSQVTQNLVYNPGFENNANGVNVSLSNCLIGPNLNGACPTVNFLGPPNWSDLEAYWDEVYVWTNCRRRNICNWGQGNGVGSADCFCDGTQRSGLRYGSGRGREYIVAPLKQALIPGQRYYIEFYYKGGNLNADNHGLRFFNEHPRQCGYNALKDDGPAHVEINPGLLGNTQDWRKYQGIYIPNISFTWVALGKFNSPSNPGTLSFDDLRIFPLGSDNCADNDWYFQNTEVFSGLYEANNRVIAGSQVTTEIFTGPVIIKNNNSVLFKAGDQVIMNPGFSTEDGAYFETIIAPCRSGNPCYPAPPVDETVSFCNASPAQLGVQALPNVNYSWSPSTFLSDPNAANPTFSPPPGSGSITYTVTATSTCGGFVTPSPFPGGITLVNPITYEVTVNYNSNPNPNPSIQITNTNLGQYFAEVNAQIGPQTEFIIVDFIDGAGNILYQQTYSTNDIGCCQFTWNSNALPQSVWNSISVCEDYTVRLSTSNFCFPGNLASDQVIWDRGNNADPPVITNVENVGLVGTPGNCLDAQFLNTDYYNVTIYNIWGQAIYSSSEAVTGTISCIWTGETNNFITTGCANAGTYYIQLEAHNCSGLTDDYVSFFSLFYFPGTDCNNNLPLFDDPEQTVTLNHVETSFFDEDTTEASNQLRINGLSCNQMFIRHPREV